MDSLVTNTAINVIRAVLHLAITPDLGFTNDKVVDVFAERDPFEPPNFNKSTFFPPKST